MAPGADTGSGHPQNGGKGPALPRGALAALYLEMLQGMQKPCHGKEGRGCWGKGPGSCELNPAGNGARQ